MVSRIDRSAKVLAAHTGAAAAAAARRASTAAASKGSNDWRSSPLTGLTVAMGGPASAGLIAFSIPQVQPAGGRRRRRPEPDQAGSSRSGMRFLCTFPVGVRGSSSSSTYCFGRL